jgi:E3 ubiquitin-protein ligase RFWD3
VKISKGSIVTSCNNFSAFALSSPSSLCVYLPGCGVKKVSTLNLKACQYIPIHVKQIRGLAFNRQADSLLLSAALDNTIKLTR